MQAHATVVHMLLAAAEQAPEKEALACLGERLSYRQYRNCVIGFAGELSALGVAGERVALIMGNSNDICIAMFAAHMAGAQIVPMNPMYTGRELGQMLQDAEVTVLIYDDSNRACVEKLIVELAIPHGIFVDAGQGRRLTYWQDQENLSCPASLPGAEDLAMLQFTGGTTGRAKGANLSHGAIAHNVFQCSAMQKPDRDDRVLCVMPLFHCYAWSVCLYNMTNCCGTVVILPRYQPQQVLDSFAAERISVFAGSPTLFTGLMNHENFKQADFSTLKRSNSGSAPLPAELLAKWEATTGTPIFEGYGQTESSPVISFNPADSVRKPGSVGIALPETEIQIVDMESGKAVLGKYEKGEIRVRGPQVMQGYRNRDAETAEALREGWLYTGDIGYLDEDDYLFITARKKEMIIVSGFNVFPREIEELLFLHPAIREAAVVGRRDDYRGELPVAYIICCDGAELDEKSLQDYCKNSLATYKVPVAFHFLEALPKTVVGKVDKVALGEMANSA